MVQTQNTETSEINNYHDTNSKYNNLYGSQFKIYSRILTFEIFYHQQLIFDVKTTLTKIKNIPI